VPFGRPQEERTTKDRECLASAARGRNTGVRPTKRGLLHLGVGEFKRRSPFCQAQLLQQVCPEPME